MITSIVFDVDDTIYDQQAPYRIAMEKCFPDFMEIWPPAESIIPAITLDSRSSRF